METVRLFAEAWKLMVGRLPSPRIEEGDGVVSVFGNVPPIFFNLSILERPAVTHNALRAILKTAGGRSTGCEFASGMILREDWLPSGWERIIEDAGLAPAMSMTGMETIELMPPRRPPAKLEIRRVASNALARDLAELNALAYNLSTDYFECIANMHLWQADSLGYVAYLDDRPVSCAAMFPVAGTVYVALVATLPGMQRQGFAETVMRYAVTQGQQAMGTRRTALHASDMGLKMYNAMGYTSGPRLIFLEPAHQGTSEISDPIVST